MSLTAVVCLGDRRARRTAFALGLATAAALAAGAPPKDAAVPVCQPAATEVAVFSSRNFGGACRLLRPGVYATTSAIGFGRHRIESIKLGRQARVQLCGLDARGKVACTTVWGDARWVHGLGNAEISFVKVLGWSAPGERCELAGTPQDDTLVALEAVVDGVMFCLKLPQADYPNAAAMGLIEPADPGWATPAEVKQWRAAGQYAGPGNVKRIVTGLRTRARVCPRPGFRGPCEDVETWRSMYPFDPVRSLRAGPARCRPAAGALAQVYAADAFWGRCSALVAGDYPTVASLRLGGAAVRTLQLGDRVSATACDAENLQGECRELPPGTQVDGVDLRSLQLRAVQAASAPGP